MQPSAPALGTPPGSKGGSGDGVGHAVHDGGEGVLVGARPGFAIAAGSAHLLTRLSLHGQGVRTIEGLEACHNLRVLVSKRI